jgi:hypothetical protein
MRYGKIWSMIRNAVEAWIKDRGLTRGAALALHGVSLSTHLDPYEKTRWLLGRFWKRSLREMNAWYPRTNSPNHRGCWRRSP